MLIVLLDYIYLLNLITVANEVNIYEGLPVLGTYHTKAWLLFK